MVTGLFSRIKRYRKKAREWGEKCLCSKCGKERIDKSFKTCERCRKVKT